MTDMIQCRTRPPAGVSFITDLEGRPNRRPTGMLGMRMLWAIDLRKGRTPSLAISCLTERGQLDGFPE